MTGKLPLGIRRHAESDTEPPVIVLDSPAAGSLLDTPIATFEGTVTDGDTVTSLSVEGSRATLDGDRFTARDALRSGLNTLTLEAYDRAGNRGTSVVELHLDITPPVLELESPLPDALTHQTTIVVSGTVEDEGGLASLTVDGLPMMPADGRFETVVEVPEGHSTVTVRAIDRVGKIREVSRTVRRVTHPEILITQPDDRTFVQAETVDVAGTADEHTASVVVNGVEATLDGGLFTAVGVPVAPGGNLLVAEALSAGGARASDKIQLFRDVVPPRLAVYEPLDGQTVDEPGVTVSGLINDIVLGTVHAGKVRVTVNGIEARVDNRSFLATSIPLAPGENVLTVEAVDVSGNRTQQELRIRYEAPVGPTIHKISGDLQEASIGEALEEPFVVELRDADGSPVADRPVVFQVLDNNGFLAGEDRPRRIVATTDGSGRASASFTLGSRAGVGNQRVSATSPGFLGRAVFRASAGPGSPARLVVDAGNQQVGVVERFLPNPFSTVVTDEGFNRLGGVDVRFRVVRGAGTFENGSAEMIVTSDDDGQASARLRLESMESVAGNVVEADLPDHPTVTFASFVAGSKIAGDPADTRITGVVLDNSDVAVPGVRVSVHGTALAAFSDDQGFFEILGAPVGTFLLDVEGDTTDREGRWPHLEFEMTTVPGRNNTVGMPIYLLPLEDRGILVSETEGGLLELPELPGFSLEVAPGSVTFPDGSRSGKVSATLVHGDKVPMVPGFGQQPRFLLTIQPAGAAFDPPARLSLPNVDGLAPGEVTELYSFDHDLGAFVSIGPGTVTENGRSVVSNPGVGILKAGWHCGGNPAVSGTPHACPSCRICNGSTCVPGCAVPRIKEDPTVFPLSYTFLEGVTKDECSDCTSRTAPCQFDFRCENGACVGRDVKVQGISGACVATVGEPVTFTAQSNKADKIRWLSAGTPDRATGGSYQVTFNEPGGYRVLAGCTNRAEKQVTALPACSTITPVLREPVVAIQNPLGTFGIVEALKRQEMKIAKCVNGRKSCIRLQEYLEERGKGVGYGSAIGKIDVPDPTDTRIVNSETCEDIIRDLFPPDPGSADGPSRSKYWVRAFTEKHEEFHEEDIKKLITDKIFRDLQIFISQDKFCDPCSIEIPESDIKAELRRLSEKYGNEFKNGEEEIRAHDKSNPLYRDHVVSIIRQCNSRSLEMKDRHHE